MNKTTKLLFDECVGHPLVKQLKESIGFDTQEVEVSHVLWLGFGGLNDDAWIPQIVDQGWIIITGDEGKSSKKGKGEKLPIVCASLGITYVTLSRTVGQCNSFQKYSIILGLWNEILKLRDAEKGSGFQILPKGNAYILRLKWPPIPNPQSIPVKKQQYLLDEFSEDE